MFTPNNEMRLEAPVRAPEAIAWNGPTPGAGSVRVALAKRRAVLDGLVVTVEAKTFPDYSDSDVSSWMLVP